MNALEHVSQHREAIQKTLKPKTEVIAEFFDDKVKPMGSIAVENGRIKIAIYCPPSIINEASGAFLAQSIALAIEECWAVKPEAFRESFP